MRVFTVEEKDLLKRINAGNGNNLYSLISPWLEGVRLEINTVSKNISIILEQASFQNQPNDTAKKLEGIQTILIQTVNLIKLFEDKGYLFTFNSTSHLPNPFVFGQLKMTSPSTPYSFPDPRLSELAVKYSTQEIFFTPELNKFINDGFITREEVRANRQFRVTFIALCVAILALLLNLGFNIYNISRNSVKNDTFNKGNAAKNDSTYRYKP